MRRTNRGMTFIEVIAAIALLALVSTFVLSGLSFIESASARDRYRLAATEVAHRVILQYMDDPTLLEPSKPYQYGDTNYRWILRHEYLADESNDKQASTSRKSARVAEGASFDDFVKNQIHQVTVAVFLWDDDEALVSNSEPLGQLTRIYNHFNDRNDEDRVKQRIFEAIEKVTGQRLQPAEGEGQPTDRDSRRNKPRQ
jgi:prepilin-type N-terminal cleavage/methylation domain-containing protein